MIKLIAKKKIRYIRDISVANLASVANPTEEFSVADPARADYYVKVGLAEYADKKANKVSEDKTEKKIVTDDKKEKKSNK